MFFPHHNSYSRPVSRPVSRPPSPTRSNTRSSISSSVPSRTPNDELEAFLEPPSPAYGPYTTDMGFSRMSSGANTPGGYSVHHAPLEIVLDSDHLVMRGAGGDMNPAYLSGRVELDLTESMNIREIGMTLVGKAKVQFADTASKNHHHTHPLLHHDWSFLEGDKRHTHTLKAGHHSFPFQLMLDSALPSSINTYAGEAFVQYKLRATVVRPGITHHNITATKTFDLQRTYTPDALEFNQTLEIENTWPGKVMYSLTLPFKAYAAGDDIPVAVKFMPLAKGVRVTAVVSSLKEYTQVHTRHSSHSDTRNAAGCKHEFREGRAVQVSEDQLRPPTHAPHFIGYRHTPMTMPAVAGPSSNMTDEEIAAAEVVQGDDEVNTFFSIHVPPWTTPTHTIHPLTVTHKLKWSCTITNPDGHISELRCALPIIILDHSLLDEARSAGANTRALLLGETVDEAQAVDLPSYSNHVYDRVAADSGPATGYTSRSSRTPTGTHTPASATPPHSRPVSRPASRPASPVREDPIPGNPPRRELSFEADSELLRALGALTAHSLSPSATPSGSRAVSRRGSFSRSGRSSNHNSRPGSRAPSPERERSSFTSRITHTFKPLTSSRPILRNSSGANLVEEAALQRHSSPSHVQFQQQNRPRRDFHVADDDPINQVPCYEIARNGFPSAMDTGPPGYNETLSRARSDTALVDLRGESS